MIQRRKPLKRAGSIKRVSSKRATQRREYAKRRAAYLLAHPFDQIAIAAFGYEEAEVIAYANAGHGNEFYVMFNGRAVPTSDQVHHRAKNRGALLNDERWWMATSRTWHDHVEGRKDWARAEGYLLPIQANAEGEWGSGNKALPTPEFMASKVRR